MPIRPLLAIPAAVALAVALAACSGSSTPPAETSSSPADDAAAPAVIDSPFAGQTLKMATDPQYPPCEFKEEGSDEIVGFDADIWRGIASRLGVTLEVEETQFDSLLPGLQSGRYDFVVGCFSDNVEREKVVNFVNYIYAETTVMTTADYSGPINDTDPLSVCGETMGAQAGFDTVTFVRDSINPACEAGGFQQVEIQTYPSAADTFNSLYSDRVDFIILDAAAGTHLNKTAPVKLVLHSNSLLKKLYLGIPVAKDNTALSDAMLSALTAMFEDGSYAEILEKWEVPSLGLDHPGINLATTEPIAAK